MREYVVTIGGEQHTVTRNADGKFVMPPELAWMKGHSVALKPAFEPIVLARKPLSEGTVAANVLRWGTGALNIDASRIAGDIPTSFPKRRTPKDDYVYEAGFHKSAEETAEASHLGRWPANVVHDGSDEVVGAFPGTAPAKAGRRNAPKQGGTFGDYSGNDVERLGHSDNGGSAARFFYSAKASKADRNGSKHPTVKPISLMQWLARLITPPGGTVLDPFAGSGTTGEACRREGFSVVLCERETEYVADVKRRFGARQPDPLARLLAWNAAVARWRAAA